MDLTVRQLTVYLEVARRRSFTAAARELRVAQSVVSRTVQDMERQLGVLLLHRNTRSVEPTLEGGKLMELAGEVLRAHHLAGVEFDRYLAGDGGTVEIAALPSVAAVLLPPILGPYLAEHPHVHARIRDGLSDAVLSDVSGGAVDIGITVFDRLPPELAGRRLITDRFIALLRPDHPLAARDRLTWSELARQPYIAVSATSSVRAYTDRAFAATGTETVNLIEAANVATVGGLIGAGLGISALPTLVHPLLAFADLTSRPLVEPVVERHLGIITRRHGQLSQPAARFVSHLERHAADAMARLDLASAS